MDNILNGQYEPTVTEPTRDWQLPPPQPMILEQPTGSPTVTEPTDDWQLPPNEPMIEKRVSQTVMKNCNRENRVSQMVRKPCNKENMVRRLSWRRKIGATSLGAFWIAGSDRGMFENTSCFQVRCSGVWQHVRKWPTNNEELKIS